jgi:hypothetical protein
MNALKVLRYMQTRDYAAVENLHLRPQVHHELETLLAHALTYNLERRLKSSAFIHRLRREAAMSSAPPQEET